MVKRSFITFANVIRVQRDDNTLLTIKKHAYSSSVRQASFGAWMALLESLACTAYESRI